MDDGLASITEWNEVKRTMTWSRYNAIHRSRENNPSVRHLLTWVAASYGYKPSDRVRTGQGAAQELRAMFPNGVIRSG